MEIFIGKLRKNRVKSRKCWLPAFFCFPSMFSKAFFSSTGRRPASYCHGVVSVVCPSVRSSVCSSVRVSVNFFFKKLLLRNY